MNSPGAFLRSGKQSIQRHGNHDRIIDIGIEAVLVFKEPAGRLNSSCTNRPIPGRSDLFGKEPRGGFAECAMLQLALPPHATPSPRLRYPRPGFARLQANRLPLFDHQPFEFVQLPSDLRRIVLIPQAFQNDHSPDDRRKDCPQAIAVIQSFHNPIGRQAY